MFTPHPSSRTLPFVPDFYYKRVVDVPNGTGKLTGPGATLKNGTGEMNGNGSNLEKIPPRLLPNGGSSAIHRLESCLVSMPRTKFNHKTSKFKIVVTI